MRLVSIALRYLTILIIYLKHMRPSLLDRPTGIILSLKKFRTCINVAHKGQLNLTCIKTVQS